MDHGPKHKGQRWPGLNFPLEEPEFDPRWPRMTTRFGRCLLTETPGVMLRCESSAWMRVQLEELDRTYSFGRAFSNPSVS